MQSIGNFYMQSIWNFYMQSIGNLGMRKHTYTYIYMYVKIHTYLCICMYVYIYTNFRLLMCWIIFWLYIYKVIIDYIYIINQNFIYIIRKLLRVCEANKVLISSRMWIALSIFKQLKTLKKIVKNWNKVLWPF